MQEIAQEESCIPLPAKASSSLRFLIYGIASEEVPRETAARANLVPFGRDRLTQGLFAFGGVFFRLAGDQLVSMFSRAGKNLRQRHQIGVLIESDFRGMNCVVRRDGHRFHLDGRTAARIAEFQRWFGGAWNFANDEVALWKRGVPHHERTGHPEYNLRSDLSAGGEGADDQRQHDKERELSSEWLHE